MAGHSKWHNIKHRKAAVDRKRGKIWTKCAKAIMVAAKVGGPDPDTNLSLRYAIDEARYANMPRDTIERAVKKGAGELGTENYEPVRYEGYGPGGVAIIIDALTNNRTRTAGDIRLILGKYGGNLGTSGCVAFVFESKGRIMVSGIKQPGEAAEKPGRRRDPAELQPTLTEDQLMELAITAGALDVLPPDPESLEASPTTAEWTVYTSPTEFQSVKRALEDGTARISDAALDMIPTTSVALAGDDAKAMLKIIDALEDNDDVQKVYTNVEISDQELINAEE